MTTNRTRLGWAMLGVVVPLWMARPAFAADSSAASSAPKPSLLQRWTPGQAWTWYRQQPWIVGFNYVPSTAANTTEFWSAETFDAKTIDRELGWGAQLGFNSCRVFVQYLVWKDDPAGLKRRLDQFLALAQRHGLRTMLVLFDDCAFGDPPQSEPYLGKQLRPVLNTEWMARLQGSQWATDLPLFKQEAVGCYSWGLVNGRTQCQFAWYHKRGTSEPKVWFHDLFRQDGQPYDRAEHEVIRKSTASKVIDWPAPADSAPATVSGEGARARSVPSTLRLPHIFSDNMVLQQGARTPVWGWAPAGQEVILQIAAQTVSVQSDRNGRWMAAFKNLVASHSPVTLTVRCGTQTLTVHNVLIGEVWLGSGQSNMEFPVSESLEGARFVAQANCPSLRLFKVRIDWSETPREDVSGGEWLVCTPETVRNFGATLYYFGREIQDRTRLPVGLVLSAVGGQRIEPFVPREGFDATPELLDTSFNLAVLDKRKGQYAEAAMDKFDEIAAWVGTARQARAEQKPVPQFPPLYAWGDPQPPHRATMLFNANIGPLLPLGLRGVVWYHGEGNEFEQQSYALKMRALVNGWRLGWDRPDLPFYFVQIASAGPASPADDRPEGWAGIGYQKVRLGQLESLRVIPHSGMAVSLDIGGGDLHPKNKQDVGKRLALWALKNDYGLKDIVPSGPLFKTLRVQGRQARITFDYAECGLMVGEKTGLSPVREIPGGSLKGFAIAGADQAWHWATAVIDSREVVVSNPDVTAPVAVRYAFTMSPRSLNLYNKAGLPASPFRTDNWFIGWGAYGHGDARPNTLHKPPAG